MQRVGYIPTAPARPGVVCPYDPAMVSTAAAVPTIGTIYACRVTVQKTGVLHDLAAYHGTASGNHRLGIYDTGDAAGDQATATRLFDSTSIALATANVWQIAGDPAIPVYKGQQLDFVEVLDNLTATMGRIATVGGAQSLLPAGFASPAGGVLSKIAWAYAIGGYQALPQTISEGNRVATAGVIIPCIIARVA